MFQAFDILSKTLGQLCNFISLLLILGKVINRFHLKMWFFNQFLSEYGFALIIQQVHFNHRKDFTQEFFEELISEIERHTFKNGQESPTV